MTMIVNSTGQTTVPKILQQAEINIKSHSGYNCKKPVYLCLNGGGSNNSINNSINDRSKNYFSSF